MVRSRSLISAAGSAYQIHSGIYAYDQGNESESVVKLLTDSALTHRQKAVRSVAITNARQTVLRGSFCKNWQNIEVGMSQQH